MVRATGRWGVSILGTLALLLGAGASVAQDSAQDSGPRDPDAILGQIESQMGPANAPPAASGGIAVLNQELLIERTLYGSRIQDELEEASRQLAAQNRQIESQLTDEELRLTELRGTMEIAEFRGLAREFDTRVEAIRAAQESKSRSLQTQAEAAQARFFELAFPILLDIVQQRGASVLMDSRSVLLSAEGVDVTREAIARVDAEIGNGGPDPLVEIDGRIPTISPTPRPEAP